MSDDLTFLTSQFVDQWRAPEKAPPKRPVRTQKGKSLEALRKMTPFSGYALHPQLTEDFLYGIWPAREYGEITFPAFARPCPTVPRHGFVESRVVHSVNEALRVVGETLEADPQGEVAFMRPLHGAWSGIATHAGVTIGKGHDGATAGKGAKHIPAWVSPYRYRLEVGLALLDKAAVGDSPYVEFVEERNRPVFVQVRNGPEQPRSRDYIPRPLTVTRVIEAHPSIDLLDWERTIGEAAGEEGVVVWHPGGALSSHYAVHTITHGIPVLIECKPEIGEALAPSGWEPAPLGRGDYKVLADRLARRMVEGFSKCVWKQIDTVNTAIATLHAQSQWGNDPHLLDLRADGFAAVLAFTAAACVGEDRHWWGSGPGWRGYGEPTCEPVLEARLNDDLSRDQIYERLLLMKAPDVLRYLRQAADDLGHRGWYAPGRDSTGYGGKSWACAAKLCVTGYERAARFIDHPTAKNWDACVSSYNQIVNATHNNGAVLNKWIGGGSFDNIAAVPGPAFINDFAARVVLGKETLPAVSDEARGKLVSMAQAASDALDEAA